MTAPFDSPGSRWFTIPAHRPFVDDLAAALFEHLGREGPEALTDAIVLTPTRRGARALAEGFVRAAGGQAVLLPQIRAVGDLDEGEPPFEPGPIALDLPPAVTPLRRRFELARLLHDRQDEIGRKLDGPAALELADALAAFMDSLWIEERFEDADVDALGGDHAKHWELSARVLRVGLQAWPARLAEIGLMDPAQRRVRLSRLLGEQWRERPPQVPLIAAGSTGTAPATADLLAVVAAAPRGCVVLPGLDRDLADKAWADVDEQHPQGAMKRLLDRHGLVREDVQPWPCPESAAEAARGRARRRVINEALRPAAATADWLDQIKALAAETEAAEADPFAEGLEGLSLIAAHNEEEAASVAALLMREALETPDRTCALVTPDQALARRVSAQLSRWGVEADSSAGAALAGFPVGMLIERAAKLACDPADPVVLLGLLKSPLARLGLEDRDRAAGLRAFEEHGLRGPRRDGWESIHRMIAGKREPRRGKPVNEHRLAELDRAEAFARRVEGLVRPLCEPFAAALPATEAARLLAETLEALAADETGGLGSLWSGPAGEAAARLLASLMEDAGALEPLDAAGFHDVLVRLLNEETVRSGGATHGRLRILGAIEARLVRADRLILAGLEEGNWPKPAPTDPFLSRPMRKALGLPPPERRIGLSAHDFAQAACAPEVVLLHTERRGGQPAQPSRWLWRLQTLVGGAGAGLPGRPEVLAWARALDAPLAEPPPSLQTAPRPEPRPPLDARPKGLYVTQVEAWVRDPYAVYARHILKLYPLDRPDEPVDARARGSAIHTAMEAFAERWPALAEDERAVVFADLYLQALREGGAPDHDMARERPLALRAGRWIADFEVRRRQPGVQVLVEREVNGPLDGLDFILSARADRIELQGGMAHVIDFKTGAAPSAKQVRLGFNAQLPLTAALLARGGLAEAGRPTPGQLLYVRVSGREPAGKEELRSDPNEALRDLAPSGEAADRAWEGLAQLVRRYADPAYPYRSRVAPQFISHRSDYDHLARVAEWSVADEDGGTGE